MANGDPKSITLAEGIEVLRRHATWRSMRLLTGKFKTKKAEAELYASLHGLCTAIELLTENGNYYREATDAYERARTEVMSNG
jgi:hypothetical protein